MIIYIHTVEQTIVSVNNERLQCASNNRKRRFRGGLRVPEGGHRENVRDEVPRQEANKNEARRNFSAQRKDNAFGSQYRSKLYSRM